MGNINQPKLVKFFFGLIYSKYFDIDEVYKILQQRFNNKIDIYSTKTFKKIANYKIDKILSKLRM